jgi:hypothetical protein
LILPYVTSSSWLKAIEKSLILVGVIYCLCARHLPLEISVLLANV